ncbi:hypothetical protein BN1723_017257, partial [Verticillium longisporum]
MGKRGSDVAKEAADMVLTDDNFSSIVTAIQQGRRLFDNIQKFLLHLLISNIAQVFLLLIGLVFQDDSGTSIFPLSPIEILWANLITSSFLAIGLGLEEAQPDILYRKPHDLRVGVFTFDLVRDKMIYGVCMGSLCLAAFASVTYGPGGGDLGHGCNEGYNPSCDVAFRARSTTFSTLSFLLLVTSWEVKHFQRSLFNMEPESHSGPLSVFKTVWKNRFLFWAVMGGFTPIQVEFERSDHSVSAAGTREIFYVRYIDWFITTPLLLLDLCLTAGLPWPTILVVILADWIMIVCGLVGSLVSSSYKWGYWVFGMFAFFYVVYALVFDGRHHANALGGSISTTYTRCGVLTIFLWFLYPIAWGLSEGGNVIHPDSEAIFYGILDVIAKPVFGFLLLLGHRNIDPAALGLHIRE